MKILMVGHFFPQKAETFILEQANALVELGHDLTILTLIGGDPDAFDERSHRNGLPDRVVDGTVYGRPLFQRMLPTIRGFLKSLIRHPRALAFARHGKRAWRGQIAAAVDQIGDLGDFDVIFAFFGTAGISAECLRDVGLFKGPIVTSFLGYDITREILLNGNVGYTRLFRNGVEFNPNSEFLRSLLLENGAPLERTHVHRLGVDLGNFEYLDRGADEDGPVRIAAVGRLVEKKGFACLLAAAGLLRDRGVDFQLEIAGSGPLMGDLESRIAALELQDHVTLLGWCKPTQIIELLHRSQLFIVPSVVAPDGDQEGLPLTMIEACSTGLPVVGTYHSGIPEAIIDGETGFLVDEHDHEALAKAIQSLCQDPALRRSFGENARAFMESRFSASEQAQALEAILVRASHKMT